MRFFHTKCGGEIDVEKRMCRRCKKKWDPISFKLDPVGIRPMLDSKGRPKPDKYQKESKKAPEVVLPRWMMFAIGTPYLNTVVSKLPKWPRWARILTTAAIVAVIILVILLRR